MRVIIVVLAIAALIGGCEDGLLIAEWTFDDPTGSGNGDPNQGSDGSSEDTDDFPNGPFNLLMSAQTRLMVEQVADHPHVQLPTDEIPEQDYLPVEEDLNFTIWFDYDLTQVKIGEQSEAAGELVSRNSNTLVYELVQSPYVGGRLVVRLIGSEQFEAEYILYGSGVPIIIAYKGPLVVIVV
jgi:hypothetical protein